MKKAVIVNAFSFVGYSLTNFLLNKGIEVVGIISEESEQEDDFEKKLLYIGRNANFMYYHSKNRRLVEELNQFDVLYYCLFDSSSKISRNMDSQYISFEKMIKQCIKYKSKIIFISSLDIFGDKYEEIDETFQPNPQNDYYKQEQRFLEDVKEANYPYTIIRLPNLYGPWQPPSQVYQHCISHNLQSIDKEIIIESTKDILFIDDVVHPLYSAGLKDIQNEIIHLSSGKRNQWYIGLQILLKEESEILRNEDRKSILFKNDKAKLMLNFKPITTFKEGIEKQIKHSILIRDTIY